MWGCLAKVAIISPKNVRIGPKTIECIFIGYAHNNAAYRFHVHKSNIPDIHKNTIVRMCFRADPRKSLVHQNECWRPIHENSKDENTDGEVEPKRSKRARIEKTFGPNFFTHMLKREPQTYKEAVNSTESLMWK